MYACMYVYVCVSVCMCGCVPVLVVGYYWSIHEHRRTISHG